MAGKHSNYTAEGKIALNALIHIYKEKKKKVFARMDLKRMNSCAGCVNRGRGGWGIGLGGARTFDPLYKTHPISTYLYKGSNLESQKSPQRSTCDSKRLPFLAKPTCSWLSHITNPYFTTLTYQPISLHLGIWSRFSSGKKSFLDGYRPYKTFMSRFPASIFNQIMYLSKRKHLMSVMIGFM